MKSIYIGVNSWIIQDGNYPDFRVGETARFALEVHSPVLRQSTSDLISCKRLAGSNYQTTARTVFVSGAALVLDFGLLGYAQGPPPQWMRTGRYVDAEFHVGIDPFFYSEELHALQGMPELRYDFRIRSIELETTPWTSTVDDAGTTIRIRDTSKTSFVPVAETNAWSDDDGSAHYILEVEDCGATGTNRT